MRHAVHAECQRLERRLPVAANPRTFYVRVHLRHARVAARICCHVAQRKHTPPLRAPPRRGVICTLMAVPCGKRCTICREFRNGVERCSRLCKCPRQLVPPGVVAKTVGGVGAETRKNGTDVRP